VYTKLSRKSAKYQSISETQPVYTFLAVLIGLAVEFSVVEYIVCVWGVSLKKYAVGNPTHINISKTS
jgi:hypothetical protein